MSDSHLTRGCSNLASQSCSEMNELESLNVQDREFIDGVSNSYAQCCTAVDDDEQCITFSDSDDDDDNSFCDDNDIGNCNLTEMIAEWAVQFNIPHVALNVLLKILHNFHSDLPLDCRRLLSTPRNTVIKKLPGGGEYIHFGISDGIKEHVRLHEFT